MKNKSVKKFLLLLCTIVCAFSLTACSDQISSSKTKESVKESNLNIVSDNITAWAVGVISYLNDASDDEIKADAESARGIGDIDGNRYIVNMSGMNVATVEFYNGWVKTREDLGKLVSIENAKVEISKETGTLCTVVVNATYEKRKCDFELVIDEEYSLSSGAINPTYTTGEKMQKAALNTLIGISTVFIVLIFISFIIYLLKFVNVIGKKEDKTQETNKENSTNNAANPVVLEEESEEDDLELIAVIAAAIAQAEGTSPEGLVVRSIRRR